MPNRIKLPPTIVSRTRAEELLGEIATLKLEERTLKVEMDRKLTAVREPYESSLTALGKQLEEKTALLESWATANPDEFPKGRKSLEMLHGSLGFRTGTPKLKTLRGWTWDRVLETLRTKVLPEFIRTKDEVNKEAMIAFKTQEPMADDILRGCGVQIVQEESFFVEPRLQDMEARTTTEVKG